MVASEPGKTYSIMKSQLKGVAVGAGYFSQFHYEAWQRIPEVNLVAICDQDEKKAKKSANIYNVPETYTNVIEMLDKEQPDFIDIITPPNTHFDILKRSC